MSTADRTERFIQEELRDMAPLFAQRFGQKLRSMGKVASGALLASMASRAIGSREVQASFLRYGRFVDMGARPGWRKGVYLGGGTPGPKPRKQIWYSRIKFGLYGQLVSNLSNKYVEALYEQAVNELQNNHGGKD